MAKRQLPPPEVLRQLLRYEPETGKLFWLPRRPDLFLGKKYSAAGLCASWNSKHSGKEAFAVVRGDGYLSGAVLDIKMAAHRVAWAIHHGSWPAGEIDHINGDKMDNKLSNLRDVTPRENRKNQRRRSDNTSGVTGVYWVNRSKRWQVRIGVDGRFLTIGRFSSLEEAKAARRHAEVRYGFSLRHGRK